MEKVIKKSGATTPAKVKNLLIYLANRVGKAKEINGSVSCDSNNTLCYLTIDGEVLSINIHNEGGAL